MLTIEDNESIASLILALFVLILYFTNIYCCCFYIIIPILFLYIVLVKIPVKMLLLLF